MPSLELSLSSTPSSMCVAAPHRRPRPEAARRRAQVLCASAWLLLLCAAPAAASRVGAEGKIHRVDPDFGSTLTVSNRDSQSNCWVNWKIMPRQPCEFQVPPSQATTRPRQNGPVAARCSGAVDVRARDVALSLCTTTHPLHTRLRTYSAPLFQYF
jgi:hypothetical protein